MKKQKISAKSPAIGVASAMAINCEIKTKKNIMRQIISLALKNILIFCSI
jgi:hypothetical protein